MRKMGFHDLKIRSVLRSALLSHCKTLLFVRQTRGIPVVPGQLFDQKIM